MVNDAEINFEKLEKAGPTFSSFAWVPSSDNLNCNAILFAEIIPYIHFTW